jgi:serine protease Do
MSDNFDNNFDNNIYNNSTDNPDYSANNAADSSGESAEESTNTGFDEKTSATESSYEWNGDKPSSSNEYHYSYINGNNETASHNPNNYENAYSTNYSSASNSGYTSSNTSNPYTTTSNSQYGGYANNYNNANSNNTNNGYNSQQAYNGYNGYNGNQYTSQPYGSPYGTPNANHKAKKVKVKKAKKPKKPVSRGFIAAVLAITIIASAALGFGGGYLANQLNSSSGSGSVNINKVDSTGTNGTNTAAEGTASDIVKNTADSVVEITTESVVTGSFARQYVQTGAGSGVIISEDGYIITNNHVIDGANSITVTLRDATTSYNATLIGTDEDNDIALLKVDATGLSPATFGDSSTLEVGDYVVAIGNPLGQLGGTVTDGIISALARKVTIDDQSMTLLQTNAQINPGNSGGGLFNANGELVGIVNAKTSATEVEGIAFAIPINNVLDIIDDLKSYGYVTGKVDLGMEFTDITSNETAFYYGVSQTGCYVLSVTSGSNAAVAGFRAGDLITKVEDTEVSSSSDVNSALEGKEVGDTVTFTVYRSGSKTTLQLTLAEYVPSGKSSSSQSSTTATDYDSSDNSIWSQMFGWN